MMTQNHVRGVGPKPGLQLVRRVYVLSEGTWRFLCYVTSREAEDYLLGLLRRCGVGHKVTSD